MLTQLKEHRWVILVTSQRSGQSWWRPPSPQAQISIPNHIESSKSQDVGSKEAKTLCNPILLEGQRRAIWLVLQDGCNTNSFIWNKIKWNRTKNGGDLDIKGWFVHLVKYQISHHHKCTSSPCSHPGVLRNSQSYKGELEKLVWLAKGPQGGLVTPWMWPACYKLWQSTVRNYS